MPSPTKEDRAWYDSMLTPERRKIAQRRRQMDVLGMLGALHAIRDPRITHPTPLQELEWEIFEEERKRRR